MNESIIVKKLYFGFNNKTVFEDINLGIFKNKITAIIGPSGCGKTTLLKLLSTQLKPNQGEILIDGKNTKNLAIDELYQLRKKMGMLFQSGALLNDLSIFDNVALALKEHTNLSTNLIRTMVLMKLQAVGLRSVCDYYPHQLSGGMLRRAALARAIALDPNIVFYDEPFAGQDPVTMNILMKLIEQCSKYMNLTAILVSHDIKEVFQIADYVCVLANKTILEYGTAQQVKKSKSAWVRQFISGSNDCGPISFHQPSDIDYQDQLNNSNYD